MNEHGNVRSEWVYWPAIPAKALADARRLEELARSSEFLARLPAGLRDGQVVIRHSSATTQGQFDVFASYDIAERRSSPEKTLGNYPTNVNQVVHVVRHFDVDGVERRLPQERRNLGGEYSPERKP